MKRLIFIVCVCCTISTYCQEITKIEYSIDKFVADGNGTSVSVSNASSFDSLLDIDISELSEGLHTIHFRSQNSDGRWSLPMQSTFYVNRPDTAAIEKIFYKFYNTSYNGEWKESLVIPTRKNVDSLFAVSTTGLDMNVQYSIEFYAVNTKGVRGHSAYLNNVNLIANSEPEALMSELNIDIVPGNTFQASMDTLFSDNDISNGDILEFELIEISDVQLNEFTTWPLNNLVQFTPTTNHTSTYTFKISATDRGGETTTIEVNLLVKNQNTEPESLLSVLNINMLTGGIQQVSMDTLFQDSDIPNGDNLTFGLTDINDDKLNEFTSWPANDIVQFEPVSGHAKTYSFKILATDTNNETATIEVNLVVDISTGIESKNLNSICIYPNPAKYILQIKNLVSDRKYFVQITNIQGSIVSEQILQNSQVDISGFSPGIYILKLNTKDYAATKRFIVQ